MKTVTIGGSVVGDGNPVVILAEAGINANGSVEIAKKLIDAARAVKCNAIKWQKRTIEVVYTAEELGKPRENPFGTTNGDLKRGLEWSREQYAGIDSYCKQQEFTCIASAWDEASVDFLESFGVPFFKIASASLTDTHLLKHHRQYKKPIILSTGMSGIEQIDGAVEVLGTDDLILLHCVSTYPAPEEDLNLRCIQTLKERYDVPVGYSGHEIGLATTVAAVALGADVIERHITLDRSMYGSDQSASVERQGFARLVRDIRVVEKAMGDGVKRVLETEKPIIAKLRRVDSQGL